MKRLSIKRALEFVRATEEFLKKEYLSDCEDYTVDNNIKNTIINFTKSAKMKYNLRKIINEMDLVIEKSKEDLEDPCGEAIRIHIETNMLVDMLLKKRIDIELSYTYSYRTIVDFFSDFRAFDNYLCEKALKELGRGYGYDNGFIIDYELSLVAFEQENMLQSYIQKKGKRGKARPKYL